MSEVKARYDATIYQRGSWHQCMVFDYDFAEAMKEPGYFKDKKVEDPEMRITDLEGRTVIYKEIVGWHVRQVTMGSNHETGEGAKNETNSNQSG